jgi:hypothetical protein
MMLHGNLRGDKRAPYLVAGSGLEHTSGRSYNYAYRPDSVAGSALGVTCGNSAVANPGRHSEDTDRKATFDGANSNSLRFIREGPPLLPLRSLQVCQPWIEEARSDPPKTARTYLPQEGTSIMSPHNNRRISQATVSPDQDQPDTAIATFSSCRPVIHSSKGSIRRVRRTHHRTQATVIICNREEQNHPLTDGVKGISGNSRPCDTASSWQYWGRRRYGPVR